MSDKDSHTDRGRKMGASPPTVFVSYSHDSSQHKDLVLRFAERLPVRNDGVQIDQYVQGTPPRGWPRWVLDNLDWAEFVLLICTEPYYRGFSGNERNPPTPAFEGSPTSPVKSGLAPPPRRTAGPPGTCVP
jgi:hypothetical protein